MNREVLLTIIITSVNKDYLNSYQYKQINSVKLKYGNLYNIKFIYEDNNSKEFNNELKDCINNIDSKYFVVIDTKHIFTNNYIKEIIEYLKTRNIYLMEPYKFLGDIPQNFIKELLPRDYYLKETSIFGVIFNTNTFKEFLFANEDLYYGTWYINYRLYYSILEVKPYSIGYSVNSDVFVINGIEHDESAERIFIDYLTCSLELKLYQLRYIILMLRSIKIKEKTSLSRYLFINVIKNLKLEDIEEYTLITDKLELGLVNYLSSSKKHYEMLYKKLDKYDVIFNISNTEMYFNCFVKLYDIKFLDEDVKIFKEYRELKVSDNVSELAKFENHFSKISKDSILIFMDRSLNADDNAEHLYSYFIKHYPEFKNAYFALHKNSKDWIRLKLKGFKLLELWSKEFYEKFYLSDALISSQIYTISYKDKNLSNSRFVYLQHGVMLNDMKDWIIGKYCDLFVATGEVEENYLKKYNLIETINTGLPRFESLEKKSDSKTILFMPTWRLKLNKVDDFQFIKSVYFKALNSFINNKSLLDFLDKEDLELVIKLHPNIIKRSNLFHIPERVKLSDESYSKLISNSKFVLTDYSSVAIDAAFINIPIGYYQFDKESFFENQPYNKRIDYEMEGLGVVLYTEEEIVDYLVNEKYNHDRNTYKTRRDDFFRGVDKNNINRNIIERILAL
ncbi:CDP-glycerol glycerophosphotransferase family protein [Clostridium tertium]